MRFPLIASGLLLATQAFAATPAEDTVRQALGQIAPNVKIEAAQESAVPGFYEAIAGGEFVYVSKDGRYLLNGSAFDIAAKRDLTQVSRGKVRKAALDRIGPDKRIEFAPQAPIASKHRVTVFTDVDSETSTRLQFFAPDGALLFERFVPAAAGNETQSFLGVSFDNGEIVGRVRIVSGNAALGPDELDIRDLVAMDDFIYGEPVATAGLVIAPPSGTVFQIGSFDLVIGVEAAPAPLSSGRVVFDGRESNPDTPHAPQSPGHDVHVSVPSHRPLPQVAVAVRVTLSNCAVQRVPSACEVTARPAYTVCAMLIVAAEPNCVKVLPSVE